MVRTKRAYDAATDSDGYRILIDRLWPRGLSKATAKLDAWEKELAPSEELREWYEHDPAKWTEFQKRYRKELKAPDAVAALEKVVELAKQRPVTLVYASRAGDISNAAVLEQLIYSKL